jgi:putative PIN family toxin of toxin-antitoxin system
VIQDALRQARIARQQGSAACKATGATSREKGLLSEADWAAWPSEGRLRRTALVSALVFRAGSRGRCADHRSATSWFSRAILDELLGVLARMFARDADELAHVALFLADLAQLVWPRRKLAIVRDDPDNRVIECAVAGRADAIVTGDRELLALRDYQGIRVIALSEYLDATER